MPTWLTWVIAIVIALIVIGALASMISKRRTEQRRTRAEELRAEASEKAGGLAESQRSADEARAKADLAAAEAERAREQAARAEQGHQVEQASYEGKLREADKLDPEVNTRAKDYEPSVWNDQSSEADSRPAGVETTAPPAADPGTATPAPAPAPEGTASPRETPSTADTTSTEGAHTRTTE